VTGAPNYGASDPHTGHCIERYHSANCAARPTRTSGWRCSNSQYDLPMDLVQHVEAATGQRLVSIDGPFETGTPRREVFAAQRQHRFGDPDDPADNDFAIPPGTRALASAISAQMGLGGDGVRAERQTYRDRNAEVLAEAGRRQRHRRHPDFGKSVRDRAERLHQPVDAGTMRQFDEP
jgi:hypothetical protein